MSCLNGYRLQLISDCPTVLRNYQLVNEKTVNYEVNYNTITVNHVLRVTYGGAIAETINWGEPHINGVLSQNHCIPMVRRTNVILIVSAMVSSYTCLHKYNNACSYL